MLKRTLVFLLLLSFGYAKASADIVKVSAQSQNALYTFSVSVHSDDLGCQQFANWREILNDKGVLLYRRILFHSHVQDTPFTRSGGALDISSKDTLYIRAHMSTSGYSGIVYTGSIKEGFHPLKTSKKFDENIANLAPYSNECWF
jgi:hypothetical protein